MDDDVDMRHYGMLRKIMPVTFLTFSMGYLAIIGFPGFSGFWSKDRIIEVALDQNIFVGVLAMIGAGITGFYMTRLMLMTFFTDKRWAEDVHPHESPKVMTIPLMVLAALILTVEMTYKVSVDSASGTVMTLFGVGFDAAAAMPWAVAIGLWIAGGWLFNIARKRVAQVWGEIQAEILQGRT